MKKRNVINIIFLVLELILYFLIFNVPGEHERFTCYLSIIVVFLYGITFIPNLKDDKRTIFMLVGLFTTLIADFFLVLIYKYREVAMISFSVTQLAYSLVLLETSRNKKIEVIVRGIGSAITLIITSFVLKESVDLLSLVSMFYYFNLIMNLVMSFVNKTPLIFKLGLIFFILCDTVIGLQTLGEYFTMQDDSLLNKILYPGFNVPWVFYLPSQVLLGYSINYFVKSNKVNSSNENKNKDQKAS